MTLKELIGENIIWSVIDRGECDIVRGESVPFS
jgi:hypothetical protein